MILSSRLTEFTSFFLHSFNSYRLILQKCNKMENQEISELIKKFDQFVKFSMSHKEESSVQPMQKECKMDTYMIEMERRLKLRPQSQKQKFQNLLKPMKELKSFVSVREFMESLGASKVPKKASLSSQKNDKNLKIEYQNLRGGYYLQKIQEHLKQNNFKRSTKHAQFYITQLDNHLETSQYRSWVENALGKISLKNDRFFKRSDSKDNKDEEKKVQNIAIIQEKDFLTQEHKKQYADKYKIVPRIREVFSQQYQSFTKVSSLLTGRLRKILKNNCASKKTLKTQPILQKESGIRKVSRPQTKQTHRVAFATRENDSNRTTNKKRVQTAGTYRREQSQIWKQNINLKLKNIIGNTAKEESFDSR